MTCPAEYKKNFPDPSKIKVSARSSLVIEGDGVIVESLDLDGALVIKCEKGATGVVRDLVVKNKGWKKVADTSSASEEFIQIRGYHLEKVETENIVFQKKDQVAKAAEVEKKIESKAPAAKSSTEKQIKICSSKKKCYNCSC